MIDECRGSSLDTLDTLDTLDRAAENGFLDNRVPSPPPAAAGRLTLNT